MYRPVSADYLGYFKPCSHCKISDFHENDVFLYLFSTYNYSGRPNNRMLQAVKRGDWETARKEQVVTCYHPLLLLFDDS